MADKKISVLNSKVNIELTDLVCIVDKTAIPIETKYVTVANFLVSLRIRRGETDSDSVASGVTKAFVFSSAIGTDITGADYDLIITCVDALNITEIIGFEISNRTQLGFEISPIADALITFTAILK